MNDDDDRTQIKRIEMICWIKKLGVWGENPSPAYVHMWVVGVLGENPSPAYE